MATTQETILASAIVVGGVWGYRKLIEPHASHPAAEKHTVRSLAGADPAPASTARFIPAFAFTYLSLAIIGVGAPDLAKSFSVLIAVSDVLTNGLSVFNDLNKQTAA